MPPHSLNVYDISGKKVNSSIGPLMEGDSLVLKCEVRGGKWISSSVADGSQRKMMMKLIRLYSPSAREFTR